MRNCLSTRVAVFCFLPVLLAGCGPGAPRDAIIGTWQTGTINKKRTMTFFDNGVWHYESGDMKYTGRYMFIADDKIEIKVDAPSGEVPRVFTWILSFSHHDKMNSTDPDSLRRTTWVRVVES
jgi:hypothetical protein